MGKEKVTFQLKTAKGTKDWEGKDMVIRDKIFSTITTTFKTHGAVTIDTPVFELKEILAGKYGEDSKLIYDLQDQAMHPTIKNIKRYHIAKVYRRDQPAMTKGRMREFYQCDFDIAGEYDPMLPDAEILRIACEVFEGLGWRDKYTIKINHRKILDGIFAVCGVPEEKIRTISSAVDKLDKSPWSEVRKEMVEEKGLSEDVANRIWDFVQKNGSKDVLQDLQNTEALKDNPSMVKGMVDMELLFDYLEAFGILDKVEFNLSLARGLDYYTGLIYEVVTEGSAPPAASGEVRKSSGKKSKIQDVDEDRSNDPTVGVGSVAAGGRYDNLVGMFSGKAQIPCVGISFGVDRIFSVTKKRMEADKAAAAVRSTEVEVYVMAFGSSLLKERMQVCKTLWDAGIKAEFSYKVKPKLQAQFKLAEAGGIPFALVLAPEEQAQGKVKIKEMGLPDGHPEKDGVEVALDNVATEIKKRLSAKAAQEERQGLSIEAEAQGKGVRVNDIVDATKELEITKKAEA